MGSKRKRYHQRSEPSWDHYSSPNQSKRRRFSQEMSPSASRSEHVNHGSRKDDKVDDEDGWTTVTSKSSRRAKEARSNGDKVPGDYPQMTIHHNYKSEIRMKDIRDLGLYLLADETAPKWTAVANSRHVKKVVVVMVPGLDECILRRVAKLAGESRTPLNANGGTEAPRSTTPDDITPDNSPNPEIQTTKEVRNKISSTETSNDYKRYTWLLDNVLQVRAPGDTKMSKVHSPLQAMLLCQDSDKKQEKNANSYSSERTPIAEFIHSADELREAEFPVHPAAFTAQLDADLEATRRQNTGQSEQHGWVDTDISISQPVLNSQSTDFISQGLSIYSLDCEMVQTSDNASSLARISLISYPDGKVIIDKYVKPKLTITNYFTQFSGITPQILENVTTTLEDIQKELLKLLNPSTVLLGHSLDSDLNALKLTHPFLIDTSLLYPHPRGLPLRSSLKYLTTKYLKREIQVGGANGHNSVEDAQAVLDLVKLKCEKGRKWGTIEANGEPIFRRLKRNGRTSAMVEYGTPERGFGKDATHTIGCQNDDEVIKGVIRAIKGDDYFDFEIPAGGVDFVWGRLRALEFARGWVSGAAMQFSLPKNTENGADKAENARDLAEGDQAEIDKIAIESLHQLQQIRDALPAKSLLVICNGTSDVRPVMRLQTQQQQYRKEFKVKKWDELTVKWTDTEEQALRKACEQARAGWAVCVIK